MSPNTQPQIDIPALKQSLSSLEEEASKLFEVLDILTCSIESTESKLQNLKANFPFSYLIRKEKSTTHWNPDEIHYKALPETEGYISTKSWYFLWDEDDITKKFRILLQCRELHIAFKGQYTQNYKEKDLTPIVIFNRPFKETKLSIRLDFSCYLPEFINEFTHYLKSHRLAININQDCSF